MTHKHSFPLKGIESLIKLAEKYNLQSLKVDNIEVVPRPKFAAPQKTAPNKSFFQDDNGKDRPPTRRESEESDLFGLGAVLGELPDSETDYSIDTDGEEKEH